MSLTFPERVNKTMQFALRKPASVIAPSGPEITSFKVVLSNQVTEIEVKVERRAGTWFVSYLESGILLDSGVVRDPSPEHDMITRIVGLAQSKSLSANNSATAEGRIRLDNLLNS